jgi:Domain of unknown function (DUF6438)
MASLRHISFASMTAALALMVVSSTSSHALQQSPDLSSLSDEDLKTVVIRLERTRCYGTCPAYVLTIHGDGQVEYVDKEADKKASIVPDDFLNNKAAAKSPQKGTVDRGVIKTLLSEFARAKFVSLPDYLLEKCTCRVCTDLPSAITEITVRGETHRVKHDYGCGCAPKELFELELAIDKAVKVEQWTGDTSNKGPFGTTCFEPKAAGR